VTFTFACYADILKEKRGSVFHQSVMLVFFKSFAGARVSPPVLLDIRYDDLHDVLAVEEKIPPTPLKLPFFVRFYDFV
jgi:hypothetical protein